MKTEKLSTLFAVAVISMFLLIAGMSVAVRGDDNSRSPELAQMGDDMGKEDSMPGMTQLIGHEEALNIAFENYNGTLVSFELEKDDDNYTYDIEIMVDGMEHQIEIDASIGEVLEEEEDDEAYEDFDPDLEQLIGHEEALDIAFKRVNGTLVAFELEEDDDNYTYDIEIVEMKTEYEFEIDAYTGEVLESEVEDNGRHRRERGVGRSWNGTQGNFTSFDLLEDGISNYTLHTNNTNLLLFESVRIQDMIIEETETQGAHYEIEGNETGIRIYDVAPALMKINTESEEEPGKVSFDLGDLEAGEQEGPNLNLSYGNYTAKLLSVSQGDGPWDESLNISVSEGTVNYTFEEDLFLVFRMTDFETQEMEQERERDREREREHEKEREMEQNISDGISQGKVGGEVIVDRDEKGFSETSVSYADMQMMTQAQENDRIRVMVSSDTLGDQGKIVGVKIYKEALDVESLEELEITFDGDEIDMADDYDDLVESSDEAQYLVSMGSESMEVLVMVPHFSTHTIEIARAETGIGSLVELQYYLPVAIITAVIILSTVWIANKEH